MCFGDIDDRVETSIVEVGLKLTLERVVTAFAFGSGRS